MGLTPEQRKHPAQAAYNKLPDGWAMLDEFWIDYPGGGSIRVVSRLHALLRSMHSAGKPWTIKRTLHHLRDYQPDVTIEMKNRGHVPGGLASQPLFIIGGKWIEYGFPEWKLIVARYGLLEAQQEWDLAIKDAADEVIQRATEGAGELELGVHSIHAMVLGDDLVQWLQEWGQRNGYDMGME